MELRQNKVRAHACDQWCLHATTSWQVDARLRGIMREIYRACKAAAKEYGVTLAAGAPPGAPAAAAMCAGCALPSRQRDPPFGAMHPAALAGERSSQVPPLLLLQQQVHSLLCEPCPLLGTRPTTLSLPAGANIAGFLKVAEAMLAQVAV